MIRKRGTYVVGSRPRGTPYKKRYSTKVTPRASAAAMEIVQRARMRKRNIRTAGYLGIEKKFLDVYASDITVPAPTDCAGGEMQPEGGCTDCLSAPAQGDGEQQRDGRKITIKSIFVNVTVRSVVSPDQADMKTAPLVFVALVQDTQANGSTIVSEQVFTNPNDTAEVNTYPLRNLQYSARFRVVDHKTVNLGPATAFNDAAATGSVIGQAQSVSLGWQGDIPVTFTGTTANISAVTDNAFHLIAFATNTNFAPVLSYNSRMRFVG